MKQVTPIGKTQTKEEIDREYEQHKQDYREQHSRQGVERRCAEIAEEYGVKKGEVIRYLLWLGLEVQAYQNIHGYRLRMMQARRQQQAEQREEERQQQQSEPRTYGHLRLIKGGVA